jgi:hypothetical protein
MNKVCPGLRLDGENSTRSPMTIVWAYESGTNKGNILAKTTIARKKFLDNLFISFISPYYPSLEPLSMSGRFSEKGSNHSLPWLVLLLRTAKIIDPMRGMALYQPCYLKTVP